MNATRALHDAGQSLWLDNITRALLDQGTLAHYIADLSITGLTSNPTIFDHAIRHGPDYDRSLLEGLGRGLHGEALFFQLAIEDLTRAADLLRPVHERTNREDGWVSLEVSPQLAYQPVASLEQAITLHDQANVPNLFVKIPGTPPGLRAIEEAIFAGVPINVTLLFSTEQYLAAADAYLRGIERRIADGRPPEVPSVASIFVSRWDKAIENRVPRELRNRLGIAVARHAYRAYGELRQSARFRRLQAKGARLQRLLWASTSTKDPTAQDTLYVEALAAPDTIDTLPDSTLLAFDDHGRIGPPLPLDGGDADEVLAAFASAGVDVDALAEHLQHEGTASFQKSWADLIACVANKCEALQAPPPGEAP